MSFNPWGRQGTWTDFLGPIVVVLVLVAITFAIDWTMSYYQCEALGKRSGRKTDWQVIGGCYVETEHGMAPEKNWREGAK